MDTANISILQKLKNIPTGGVSPFHCKVYFVNKVEQMAIRWGTDSKIQYLEPSYGFPLSIGASGEMSLRVQDSKKLLINLVSMERNSSPEKLVSYFRAFLMTRVKTYIAQIMKASAISIFEIDEHLLEFSNALQEKLRPDFADYGISLERFFVTAVAKPDGEAQYEKFKELHFRQYADIAEAQLHQKTAVIDAQTEAQKTVIASQATATKRAQEGYTYQQERSFDVAEKVADDEDLRKRLKLLYQKYKRQGYLMTTFQSGSENLTDLTGALLTANRRRMAEQMIYQSNQQTMRFAM